MGSCMQVHDVLAKHGRRNCIASSATTIAVQCGYVAIGTDKGEVLIHASALTLAPVNICALVRLSGVRGQV
jgi:hypothetical protein